MDNSPNSSDQALEDYFDDLLGEPAPLKGDVSATALKSADVAPFVAPVESLPPARPAAKLAQLPTRATVALRAYAEPVRTFNLRMPLPQLAPQAEAPPTAARPVALAPVESPVEVPIVAPAPLVTEARVAVPAPAIEVGPLDVEPEVAEAQGDIEPEVEQAAFAPPAWLDNGRPAWAQQPFECLLFSVGGLSLAAPLAELGAIYPLESAELTGLFGQVAWFMGLLPVKGGGNLRVIDAAQVVMPERYAPDMRERYRYAISLHGFDWALAVDSVADSVLLHPDDVRWRGQRGKRPWLAGTVIDRMCALLDMAQLAWMFESQDGKRTPRP